MRSVLGPYRASMTQARRRRVVRVLIAAMIAVFGLIAWSSYPDYRNDRHLLTQFERGDLDPQKLLQQTHGFNCDPDSCQLIDSHERPFGPRIPISQITRPQPGEKGPQAFGPEITPQDIEQHLAEFIPDLRAQLKAEGKELSPRTSLQARTRSLGTFWGVLFAVFIAATIIGAEWRWGVWRTLLTHEPRRRRLLLAKFATVWTMIAITFAIIVGVTAGLDAIFRTISSVSTSGGPSTAGIARGVGKSLLSLELYATFAASLTMIIRASFAGVGSLVLLLGDGLASHKWPWLRHALPTQQIARLIAPPLRGIGGSYVWFPLATSGRSVCTKDPRGFDFCHDVLLPPVPQWRAVVVLLGWILLATLIAWIFLRARDVPQ